MASSGVRKLIVISTGPKISSCASVDAGETPVTSVGAEATPKQILRTMEMAELRRVPVVDAEGRVVGVISREDLTRRFDVRAPGAVETLVERLAMPAD